MGFYLQRRDNPGMWEEVDFYVWELRDKALDKQGNVRYSGNAVCQIGGKIAIEGKDLSTKDLAVICRFLGVRESEASGSTVSGFLQKPEFVQFKGRAGKLIMHQINGPDFVCKAPAIKAEEAKPATKEL